MNTTKQRIAQNEFIAEPSEHQTMTLEEVAYCAGTTTLVIQQLAEEELIEPVTENDTGQRFDVSAVRRIIKALRIHGHLGVEVQSLTLIMQLLDRIDRLEEELHRIKKM
ncbi:MAG: chaperone modulator CbpM [Kiritimatiellae bacterium]|nr:chaperone modulator CbpM [Kiritimatiellia bacterium]